MKLIKDLTTSFKTVYERLPTSGIILLLLALLLSVIVATGGMVGVGGNKEGITNREDNFLFKSGVGAYDSFYSEIYDFLVYNDIKNEYEIGAIMNRTNPTTKSAILDIGCGTGHHVGLLAKDGLNVIGIDASPAMIEKAKTNYPQYRFMVGDAMNSGMFPMTSFTHILCLYFTIYYFQDKTRFFRNCYDWLMPGGYLIIHLVDRDHFDPLLPSGNPLFVVSPQKYAKSRITKTKVTFDKFKYESEFVPPSGGKGEGEGNGGGGSPQAIFNEKFVFNDGHARRHEHQFFMEPHTDILTMAQDCGFTIAGQIDMVKCAYEYQYLYVLTKPAN
jgi:SAM-dependent methyltransferase